jgi:hypothetical protein
MKEWEIEGTEFIQGNKYVKKGQFIKQRICFINYVRYKRTAKVSILINKPKC